MKIKILGGFDHLGMFGTLLMILQIGMKVFLGWAKLEEVIVECISSLVPKGFELNGIQISHQDNK